MTRPKALFLDRDGVINYDKKYVYRIDDFEFRPEIFEVLHKAQSLNYLSIIVTNQAGIGRGYYSENDFQILNDWMKREFAKKGIRIQAVYFCPYHPEHGIGKYKKDSNFRKPGTGMILQAAKEYDLDLKNSVLVGDKPSDIEAGRNAAIGKTILVKSDYTINANGLADHFIDSPIEICNFL